MAINDDEYLTTFLINYLPKLPDDILIQIFDLLTFDYLLDFFMHFPDENIRDLLIRHYYSTELHFIIMPTKRPYVSSYPIHKREFITFYDMQISQFMNEFPKIIPKRLLIISGASNFKGVMDVLGEYRDRIDQVEEIEITLERCDKLTLSEFEFLILFKNLRKIHCSGMNLKSIRQGLINNPELINHPKLNEIVFLGHEINDWSGIKFPEVLKSLDLSWNNSTNITTLTIPNNVNDVYFNKSNINDLKLLQNKLCDDLTTLMLTYNQLEAIVLEDLPLGLRTLDLSSNRIKSITGKIWPPDLDILLLNDNLLDDNALNLIDNKIGWPTRLTNLGINHNQFNRIHNLSKLPQGLEILNISMNPLVWEDSEQPFEFPRNLINLNMSECRVKELHYLRFPESLNKLTLAGNGIFDILSYENWTTLVNLDTLELFHNSIVELDDWIIPPNLRKLDLQVNPIVELTGKFPLFNDRYNFKLIELNLSGCNISKIEIDYIPASLKNLNISLNELRGGFIFPSSFKQLYHLDLSENEISSLKFTDKSKSQLQSLNLGKNLILRSVASSGLSIVEVNQFYIDLESNLGNVKKRKFNVNGLHLFESGYL